MVRIDFARVGQVLVAVALAVMASAVTLEGAVRAVVA